MILDFHLVDSSKILGEFESFYYNRNVDNGFWYEKANCPPAPHLTWFIDSQLSGKGSLIVLKNNNKRKRKFLLL